MLAVMTKMLKDTKISMQQNGNQTHFGSKISLWSLETRSLSKSLYFSQNLADFLIRILNCISSLFTKPGYV